MIVNNNIILVHLLIYNTGVTCIGHTIGRSVEQGSTVPEILLNLRSRFCGCTHISGSVLINMASTPSINRQLNASDFNFLYHVEQVSGSISFRSIPATSQIILPNLRLIRGEEVLGKRYSLVVLNSTLGELILPRLTQISRGDVLFEDSGELCNHNTVNWPDILDGGNVSRINTCPNPTQSSKFVQTNSRKHHAHVHNNPF